ncbi:MAG TPA: hypothetical protein PK315_12700 [Petrotogaceae bacterium]|jgi:hypothetical protein|nr:hypothetical protein [Petrotogaceae bacterium]HPO28331.1 hypothetical protein [Petrotogaceae bacterium]
MKRELIGKKDENYEVLRKEIKSSFEFILNDPQSIRLFMGF